MQALPERPNLDHLRRQAKDLRLLLRTSDHAVSLATAQALIARRYGFRTWPELKVEVERRRRQQEVQVLMSQDGESRATGGGAAVPARLQQGRALAVFDGAGTHVGSLTAMVRKSLSNQPVLRIRERVPAGQHHPSADLSTILRALLSQGLVQAGPPYGLAEEPDGDGTHDVEWGIPTSAPGRAEGGVEAAVQPGGPVATAFYYGPFSGLPDAHRQLGEQIAAAGLIVAGPARDLYHTAPEETDPDHHVTELVWPLEE